MKLNALSSILVSFCAIATTGCAATSGQKPDEAANAAKIPSVADFAKRAENGDALTVVFLGCSLTWGADATDPNLTSARGRVMEYLRTRYPQARWRFCDAAIGGTSSTLGIFRVDRDVLAKKPDLVFVDFTLNDNLKGSADRRSASYEAVLRRILLTGHCPIVAEILAGKEHAAAKDLSVYKRRLEHLALLEKYGIPCADVVKGMNDDAQAGKIDLDVCWPPEKFDNTHPADAGYAEYAKHIEAAYEKAAKSHQGFTIPEKPVFGDEYAFIERKKLSALELPEGWRKGICEKRAGTFDFLSSRWLDGVVIAENAKRVAEEKWENPGSIKPAPFTFKAKGVDLYLFGEAMWNGGELEVSIDGGKPKTVSAQGLAKYLPPSTWLFITLAEGLEDKEHVVTLTPVLSAKDPQMIKLESVCVAGPSAVCVKQ